MGDNKNLYSFPVVIYGDISKYNDVLSQARCRVFYKYENRNRTYITDEFAEKLISSLPYVPVKGIYDSMQGDYTDHGKQRYEGRIYGIVPENPNFAWETHLDDDGVQREYACVDVLLFTGIYQKEALEVLNKSQSMELYADSINGDWKYINGQKYFVFTEGCFLGLQVLGENVEPCFEGAAFYTLYDSLTEMLKKLEEYNLNSLNNKEEETEMTVIDFKLSDNQKHGMIFSLLNPNFNEEGGWVLEYCICDVYDEYALVYGKEGYERAYYVKDDATDSLEITNREAAYVVDVTEAEKNALVALRTMNGETFEKVDEKFSTIETLEKTCEEFDQKIKDQDITIATLNNEKENISDELEQTKTNYAEASDTINALNEKVDALENFKYQVELNEKKAVIDSYVEKLDAEIIENFNSSVEDYTKEELEKELAFALVKSKPSLFNNDPEPTYVPKDEDAISGIEEILSRYKK